MISRKDMGYPVLSYSNREICIGPSEVVSYSNR